MPSSISDEPNSVTTPSETSCVERLHVVRQPRDDRARLAARVEADRQRLEVGEELDPQVLQRALADPADEVGLRVRRAPVHERAITMNATTTRFSVADVAWA